LKKVEKDWPSEREFHETQNLDGYFKIYNVRFATISAVKK
jgi:hypothetical protein